MGIKNVTPFIIPVDFKKTMHIEEPVVTQNDDITFIVEVYDDEIPFDLTGIATVTMVSERVGAPPVLTNGTKTGINQMTFVFGSNETSKTGKINTTIQIYDAEGRVSTVPFTYRVRKDPVIDFVPSENEKTLIELVLGQGPEIIEAARLITIVATEAEGLRAIAETQRVESEIERVDAEDLRIVSEDERTLNEVERLDAEVIRVTAEDQRIISEGLRSDAEEIRVLSEIDRVQAEQDRQTNTGNAIQNVQDSIRDAGLAIGRVDQKIIDVQKETDDAIDRSDQKLLDIQEQADEFGFKEEYSPTSVYHKNNVVYHNKASWIYINDVAGSGNTPPTLPTTTNTHWQLLAPPGVDGTGTGTVTKVDGVLPNQLGEVTTHTNKDVLDKFEETGGKPTYNGVPIGAVQSVNGGTGAITGIETVDGAKIKDDKVLDDAKAYTDQEIANVSASGNVKQTYYDFEVTATTDGQTDFVIPLVTYDIDNDKVSVHINTTTPSPKSDYELIRPNIVRFYKGKTIGTVVDMRIDKNVLTGLDGAVSGTLINPGTMPEDRVIGLESKAPIATTLNRGVQIVTVSKDTPVNVLNFTGKTIINYAPLFDSGLWFFNANVVVNSPNQITLNANAISQYSYVQLDVKPNTDYTVSLEGVNVAIGVYNEGGTTAIVDYIISNKVTFNTGALTKISVFVRNGSATGTYVIRNVMLNEGTMAHEFVANVKGVTNPTITVQGLNLAPDFNSGFWGTSSSAFSINNKNEITQNGKGFFGTEQNLDVIPLKPNTDYTISVDHNQTISVLDAFDWNIELVPNTPSTEATFNSGNSKSARIILGDNIATGLFTFKNVMLNEGTVALPFESYRKESLTIQGTFHTGDVVDLENRSVKRSKREIVLDGSLPWRMEASILDFKKISLSKIYLNGVDQSEKVVKYNGKVLTTLPSNITDYTSSDRSFTAIGNYLAITVDNKDSGWGPNYVPTVDELKAYFNGWKMYDGSAGISDTSMYTRTDGLQKGWARYDKVLGWQGDLLLPTTKSTTGINGTGESYRLIYDLVAPVKETIKNIGSLRLASGDNNVVLTEGRIVRERVYPKIGSGTGGSAVFNLIEGDVNNPLKHKIDTLVQVYKNGEKDRVWFYSLYNTSYGGRGYVGTVGSNFDPTAIYEAEYIPLELYKVSSIASPIAINYRNTLGGISEELVDNVMRLDSRLNGQRNVMDEILRDARKKPGTWTDSVLQNGWSGSLNHRINNIGQLELRFQMVIGAIDNLTAVANIGVIVPTVPTITVLVNDTGVVSQGHLYIDRAGWIRVSAGSSVYFVPGQTILASVVIPLD